MESNAVLNARHLQVKHDTPLGTASGELVADQADEIFDVVDESNTTMSTATRQKCHESGLLHRSAHVFLFRNRLVIGTKGPVIEVLLQKRSENKKVGANLWDVSVAEHLSAGETYLDASVRGLAEELHLSFDADALVTVRQPYLSRQLYEEAGVLDNMFTSTFCALYDEASNGPVVIDEAEVQDFRWWPVGEVARMAKNDSSVFTRWLLIELASIDIVELGKRVMGEE